ncbi:related to aflatoxin efflux pump AFLT [Phialocephala subalpina]|uniref:Related to aflatoxin efflux pump AFLT n=1 Tax=Phialocephala subalpina TaxID=576137 RepID=A0A1L7X599_9HELO|nr:related to aflatoxin efflux pump AFLT [Phialocephala subalpina]
MESSRESSPRREKPEGNVPVAVDPASNSSSEDIAAKYDQAEANYQPKSFKFWTILLGLYLAVFIVALDRTIIATAIPAITDEFHSLQDVGWYASSYMLTGASSNLVFGKIYKYYSTKWSFLASIFVFEVGSALCGAAPNSIALIVGRAIAGLGSSGIFSGGMMILVPLIPLRKRPIYYALFGIAFGVSSVLGPVLGGIFTDKATWRWCFYINLPIGAITVIAVVFFLHIDSAHEHVSLKEKLVQLDPIGTFFLIPSVVSLILALQWGGTTYAWGSAKVVGLLVCFGALFVLFWLVQIFIPRTATVKISIITQRSIACGVVFLFALTGSLFIIVYYLPIWFQVVKGDSAVHSGISTLPLVLGLVVFSIVSGKATQRVGYYVPFMIASPLMTAVGAGLLYTLAPDSNHEKWIGYQVLYGLGTGAAMQLPMLAVQAVLPAADISSGMALMFFAQQLGGAIFVAVGQNIFDSRVVSKLTGIPGLNAQQVVHLGATQLRSVVPAQYLGVVINAFNYGCTGTFLVAVGLSAATLLAAVGMEWKNINVEGKKDAEKGVVEVEPRFE